MAKEYGVRPSALLGLTGWAAYCLDQAILYRAVTELPEYQEQGTDEWQKLY